MKFVLAIASLMVLSVVYAYPSEIRTFEEFKKAFNKNYITPEAEEVARRNFLNSLKYIDNAGQGRINHLSDLSLEEFKKYYMMSDRAYEQLKQQFDINAGVSPCKTPQANYPAAFDLRALGTVPKIKDQGFCGSCWAFSTLACVESTYLASRNQSLDLSEQELVDCAAENGCDGDTVINGMGYVKKNGVVDEKSYPYIDGQQKCKKPNGKRTGISSFCMVYPQEGGKIRQHLVGTKAAISVVIGIKDMDAFRHYDGKSIIMKDNGPKNNYHAINIVGYGLRQGIPYWVIRNSWSTTWGDQGYGYMLADENFMGIETSPLVVNL